LGVGPGEKQAGIEILAAKGCEITVSDAASWTCCEPKS
jgi:hypothetical protein